MAHHRLATSAVTCGVKYRPNAVPMIHCPVLRSGPELSVARPATDASAVATSGPIIHGNGVRRRTHSAAAPSTSSRVKVKRRM